MMFCSVSYEGVFSCSTVRSVSCSTRRSKGTFSTLLFFFGLFVKQQKSRPSVPFPCNITSYQSSISMPQVNTVSNNICILILKKRDLIIGRADSVCIYVILVDRDKIA